MRLNTGHVINNRYRIVKPLELSRFGVTYRAWDLNLNRPVRVTENLDTSPEAIKRFEIEANILAALSHPNLPRITDHFVISGLGNYLVSDYIEGENLEILVDNLGAIISEQAISWMVQVSEALEYLHSQRIPVVHGDVKPSNVLITPTGRAVLIGYGSRFSNVRYRQTLTLATTTGYAAPELYAGRMDIRTDIYALGATFYKMLTGEDPVDFTNRAVKDIVLPHLVNPKVNPRVSQVVARAMALPLSDRYQDVANFKNDLVSSSRISRPFVSAQPTASIPFPQTAVQPSMIVGLLGVVLIVAIFLFALIAPYYSNNAQIRLTPTFSNLLPSISPTTSILTKTVDSVTKPVEIAVLNVKSETQSDGNVYTTADLSISPLGLGSLDFTSPTTMRLGESGLVRLVIIPDSALTGLPLATITPLSANDSGAVLQFSDQLQIYPVMRAELNGANFEIVSDGYLEKPVTSTDMVEWVWSVTPKKIGRQSLVLIISVPVIIDQARDILSVRPLKSIPIEIVVEGTPTLELSDTPVPAPATPVPISDRIRDQLIENTSSIFAAILVFISGLFTVYATIRSSMIQADVKNLREQLQKDVREKEKLEKQIEYLESLRWWQIWRKRK